MSKKLLATQAGIVFPKLDEYYLLKAPHHMGQPDASIFERGKGKPVLYTEGINYCAGIEVRTDDSYSLIHGMGLGNTRVLLGALIGKHMEIGVKPQRVQVNIKTDYMRDDYEREVGNYLRQLGIDAEIRQIGWGLIPNEVRIYSLQVG